LSVAKELVMPEANPETVAGQSEETSFMAGERKKGKGAIETV
jgi:hypothetical protein